MVVNAAAGCEWADRTLTQKFLPLALPQTQCDALL
jgi:hypothetical protein